MLMRAGGVSAQISQGALGDCWFLSALSVVAMQPHRIRACFVTPSCNEAGAFCVRFFKNGAWKHVLIDDAFPASGGGMFRAQPKFGSSKQRDELCTATWGPNPSVSQQTGTCSATHACGPTS